MKPTPPNSLSNQEVSEPKKPHPWLLKHYEEKRKRTARLVKASVDQLVKEGEIVTIDAICRVSPGLDPEGRGVKKSAILENPEAHAYYREHSTSYQTAKNRNRRGVRKGTSSAPAAQPLRIDPQRDVERVRYRYIQMTKAEIVELCWLRGISVPKSLTHVKEQAVKKSTERSYLKGIHSLLARQTSSMKHKGLFSLFQETMKPGHTQKHSYVFSI